MAGSTHGPANLQPHGTTMLDPEPDNPPLTRLVEGTMVLMHGQFVHVESELASLTAEHAGWYGRFPTDEPLYALPRPIIDRMADPARRGGAAIGPDDAQAECLFVDFCRAAKAVGTWAGRPIAYPALLPPIPPPTAEQIAWIGAPPSALQASLDAIAEADRIRPNLAGYAGRVITDPAFLAARNALRDRWRALPSPLRPEFPLHGGALIAPAAANLSRDPDSSDRFLVDLETFLEDWELLGLATWDLPLPRGPLLPDLRPRGTRGGIPVELPGWYPISGSDDLAADLRHLRPQGTAPLEHADLYASMLNVDFAERAMATRAPGTGGLPRGWVGLVVDALADAMNVSTDHVRALRKAISARRRGRPESASILNRRARP